MVRITEHHVDIISVNAAICGLAEKIAKSAGGISITQYRILLRLYMTRGPVSMAALAEQLLLSKSAATAAVDKLEQTEAVDRTRNKKDRRIVQVRLEPQGVALIKSIDKGLADPIDNGLKALTEEQRSVLATRCVEVVSHFGLERIDGDRVRLDTAFLDTALLIRSQIVKAARSFGLSVNDYRVLYLLSNIPRETRSGQVARELLMRPSEVTVAANKLESRRLVKRSDETLDRRGSLMEITNEGFSLIREAAPFMAECILYTHPAEYEVIDTHDAIAHTWAERQRARWIAL